MFLTLEIPVEILEGAGLIDEYGFEWKKNQEPFGDIGHSIGSGESYIPAFRDPVAEKLIIMGAANINTYLRIYYFPKVK